MGKKLTKYRKRRDFTKTAEPKGKAKKSAAARGKFALQKHAASRLHFDFRIEIDGVLKSWAIPKGPSLAPATKRLAMLTEDHPMEYGKFEGIIPKGEYGAGTVMLWDFGTFKNLKEESLSSCFKKGRIEIFLKGKRLEGAFALIRFRGVNQWLLIKMRDEFASKKDIVKSELRSAKSGKTMQEIAKGKAA